MNSINGLYVDVESDAVYIYGHAQEIVSWTQDEWAEDPTVVISIMNAILFGIENGPDALAKTIKKRWNGEDWEVFHDE